MKNNIDEDEDEDQKRYNKFIEELEKISNKGYAISECLNFFIIKIPVYIYKKIL